MHKIFFDAKDLKDNKFTITGEDFKHLIKACRVEVGEKIGLLDGKESLYIGKISEILKSEAIVEILKQEKIEPTLPIKITLAQGLPKSDKLENIIQKTTELGVSTIIPTLTKNCDVKIKSDKVKAKLERWQKITKQACMQSGQSSVPIIESPINLFDLSFSGYDSKIVLWENEQEKGLKSFLNLRPQFNNILIIIGPEGGFTPEEIKELKKRGVEPISIGKSVLRTETAAIAVLAMLNFFFS